MYLATADGAMLRGDLLAKAEQRFDLLPVPSTLTLYLRSEAAINPALREDAVLLAGARADRYRIVKTRRKPSEWVQGGTEPVELVEVIALLEGFAELAKPLPRGVVKEGASLGEIYRACGARGRIKSDIPTRLFVCPAGHLATPGIAQLLQEEAAAAVWADGGLSFVRLPDLFNQEPVQRIGADITQATESRFLELHDIPAGVSTGPDGALVRGRRDASRPLLFLPRTPERILNNITRCLVVRRTLGTSYAGDIQAGAVMEVAGVKHVITTAAHGWQSGAGGGPVAQVSKFWLAELSR